MKDPCPLPGTEKKRSLNEKERLIYAPLSGMRGTMYDKDAIYIDMGNNFNAPNKYSSQQGERKLTAAEQLMETFKDSSEMIDEKLKTSQFKLTSGAMAVTGEEFDANTKMIESRREEVVEEGGRRRRRVVFDDKEVEDEDDGEMDDEEGDDEDEGEEMAGRPGRMFNGNYFQNIFECF